MNVERTFVPAKTAAIRLTTLAALAVPLLSGCGHAASVHGLRPLHPSLELGPAPKVSGLQPTLRWQEADGGEALYDVIVYRMARSWRPNDPMDGRTLPEVARNTARAFDKMGCSDDWNRPSVYYRQGLSSASHRLETPLAPDTFYLWSIRTRTDGKVSQWSTADWRGQSKEDTAAHLAGAARTVVVICALPWLGGFGGLDVDSGDSLQSQSTRPLSHHPFVFTTP